MIFVAQNAIQLQQQQSQKRLSAIKNYARIVKIIESKIAIKRTHHQLCSHSSVTQNLDQIKTVKLRAVCAKTHS